MLQPSDDLAGRAREFDQRARYHRREAGKHRRKLRECRQQQAAIEAECRRLGIEVNYTTGEGRSDFHGQACSKYSDPHRTPAD